MRKGCWHGSSKAKQLSAIAYRLSLIGYRLSAIGYVLLLTACATPPTPTPAAPPLPTVIPFTPFDSLPQQGQVTLVGYLLIENGSAILAPAANVGSATPTALGDFNARIWCGDATQLAVQGVLASTGGVQHGLVIASGVLDPPGAYGTGGTFTRQLQGPKVMVIAPQEASVADIRTHMETYRQRIVRVIGWFVVTDDSAVLIDKLGDGGMPAPNAVSLKLRQVPDDPVISAGLQSASGGSVRYGQVQIEGAISDGALIPVTMRLVGK